MSPRLPLLSLLAAPLLVSGAVLTPPRRPHRAPACYATVVALVADPHPFTIRRIVTSGVRRFDDAGGGTRTQCVPTEPDAPYTLHRLVGRQLGTDSAAAQWIDVSGTDPQASRDVIPRILTAVALRAPGFEFVEIVGDAPGSPDSVATRLVPNDSAHTRCVERNAGLERRRERFRYAC